MKIKDYLKIGVATLVIIVILSIISSFMAGFEKGSNTKNIVDNANKLKNEYNQKIDSVNVAVERINTLGNKATKEQYIELKNKYEDAIKAGDGATSYINDNLDVIDVKSYASFLTTVTENKVKFETSIKEFGKVINDFDKNVGAVSAANRLLNEYNDKLNLVTEIQKRTDALGTSATKEIYVEWKNRNNVAIDAGERLATYITENINALDSKWVSDTRSLIAKNKERLERDNQNLEQIINKM